MASADQVETALRNRWTALTNRVPVERSVLDDLLVRHAEPQRHYHTGPHVLAVLVHLDTLVSADPAQAAAVQLAAFFHDAVYDPQNSGEVGSNEQHSAQLARASMSDCSSDLTEHVVALIEATEGHRLVAVPFAAEFLDADLSILGSEPGVYDRYAQQIRAEYNHVPAEAYVMGRPAILQGFLDRDRLFFSELGTQWWEQQARENLQREIDQLTA